MEKIKIGVIVNTHGLRGELKVKSFTQFNEIRFKKKQTIYIRYRDEDIPVCIQSVKEHKGMLLLTFENLLDINEVEKYKTSELYIDASDLHDLDEDEVYYFDLMGCSVEDQDGNVLGEVEDVIETGANAVLRVNQKILIPFVKTFILSFDVKEKRIVVQMMEGLL